MEKETLQAMAERYREEMMNLYKKRAEADTATIESVKGEEVVDKVQEKSAVKSETSKNLNEKTVVSQVAEKTSIPKTAISQDGKIEIVPKAAPVEVIKPEDNDFEISIEVSDDVEPESQVAFSLEALIIGQESELEEVKKTPEIAKSSKTAENAEVKIEEHYPEPDLSFIYKGYTNLESLSALRPEDFPVAKEPDEDFTFGLVTDIVSEPEKDVIATAVNANIKEAESKSATENFISPRAEKEIEIGIPICETCEKRVSRLTLPYPGIVLREGMRNDYITAVQRKLNELSKKEFRPINASGFFGKRTLKAIWDFQEMSGLTPTGTVNRETWEKLFSDSK